MHNRLELYTGVLRGHLVFKRMRLHSLERMATMGGTWRSLPSMVVMGFSLKIRHTVFSKTVLQLEMD